MLTRRQFAAAITVAPALTQKSHGDVQVDISRFMMKDDGARVVVRASGYRFAWHGRFFGFRLATPEQWDSRISYSNFGIFERGGIDLICNHYQPILLNRAGKTVFFGGSSIWASERADVLRLEHFNLAGQKLRLDVRFWPDAIEMVLEPGGFSGDDPLLLTLPGNLAGV